MKRITFLMLMVTILSSSCGTFKKLTTNPHETCYTEMAPYVRSAEMPKKWFQGQTTIIYMADTTCVVIWGDKCDFTPGEMLIVKQVWWSSIGVWKDFLINEPETITYSLLRPH